MSTTTHSKLTSASTCGLHPWLHEQVLELVSLSKDPIKVDLDANDFGFPRARANHGALALLGPSRDRLRKPQAETKKLSTTTPGRIFNRGEGRAGWRKWENREEKGKKKGRERKKSGK